MPVDGGEIPQWVTYLGAAAGAIVTTVIVRLGWTKGGEAPAAQPEQGRLIGALVDASSIRELTLAVQALTEVIHNVGRDVPDELRSISDEIRRLGSEVRGNRTERQ